MKTKFLLTTIAIFLFVIIGLLIIIILTNPFQTTSSQPAIIYSTRNQHKNDSQLKSIAETITSDTPGVIPEEQVTAAPLRKEEQEKLEKFAKYGIEPREAMFYERD